MYTNMNPLANGGRHSITGDTQVCAHFRAGDLRQLQHLALVCENCWHETISFIYRREAFVNVSISQF